MALICEYCRKEFSSKGNLTAHKKRAKYCLKIQGEYVENKTYTCTGCNSNFSYKSAWINHKNDCKDLKIQNLEKEVKHLSIRVHNQNLEIASLEKELVKYVEVDKVNTKHMEFMKEAVLSPKNVNNTTHNTTNNTVNINTPLPLKNDHLEDIFTNFNYDHFRGGQIAVANFLYKNLLTNKDTDENYYLCVDYSRQIFKFMNEDGDIIDDTKAIKLIDKIYPSLKARCKEIVSQRQDKCDEIVYSDNRTYSEIDDIRFKKRNKEFRAHLAIPI